jgi:hypothetical protein
MGVFDERDLVYRVAVPEEKAVDSAGSTHIPLIERANAGLTRVKAIVQIDKGSGVERYHA